MSAFNDAFDIWMDEVFEKVPSSVMETFFNLLGKMFFHVRLPFTDISIGMMMPPNFAIRLMSGEWGTAWYTSNLYIPKGFFTAGYVDDIDGERAAYDPVKDEWTRFYLTELTEDITFVFIVVAIISKTSQGAWRTLQMLLNSRALKRAVEEYDLPVQDWNILDKDKMGDLKPIIEDLSLPAGTQFSLSPIEPDVWMTDIDTQDIMNAKTLRGLKRAIYKAQDPRKVYDELR
jgi:hypothetical protein